MGNTVTCCVSPDASPKLGRARGGGGGGGAAAGPERWADAYQAAAAAGGGGGGSAAEADSGDSDPGGGGPHLQHISDREFPDGERRRGPVPGVGREGAALSRPGPPRPPALSPGPPRRNASARGSALGALPRCLPGARPGRR
uniref:Uncharacterized protein n=1 Tax=Cairina moschata TaxID=8855 RepID=A0A8C3CXP2_CAIMO